MAQWLAATEIHYISLSVYQTNTLQARACACASPQMGPHTTQSITLNLLIWDLQSRTWRVRVSQTVQRPSWLAAARQAPLGLHAQLIPASLYPLSVPNATYPVETHAQCFNGKICGGVNYGIRNRYEGLLCLQSEDMAHAGSPAAQVHARRARLSVAHGLMSAPEEQRHFAMRRHPEKKGIGHCCLLQQSVMHRQAWAGRGRRRARRAWAPFLDMRDVNFFWGSGV